MKTTILAACALLAATGALATAGWQAQRIARLEREMAGDGSLPVDDDAPAPQGQGSCLQRVQALETRVALLQTRLARREAGGAPVAVAGRPATGVDGVDPESVLLEALDSDNPEVRERIKGVVAEEQQRLHQEHRQERMQRWAERSREMVGQLARDHGFSEEQTDRVNAQLDQEREQIRSLFEGATGETGFRGLREQMRAIRDQTDGAVKELLDEGQFAAYQTMREEQRPRFGGRGWGGGEPPRPGR
jgi:hypothetical protein